MSMPFSSILPIDRTLSSATTPGQIELGSDGNERALHIPQSSSIIGTSPSDCLVSYPGQSLVGVVLPLCRGAVCVFYSLSQLDKQRNWSSGHYALGKAWNLIRFWISFCQSYFVMKKILLPYKMKMLPLSSTHQIIFIKHLD